LPHVEAAGTYQLFVSNGFDDVPLDIIGPTRLYQKLLRDRGSIAPDRPGRSCCTVVNLVKGAVPLEERISSGEGNPVGGDLADPSIGDRINDLAQVLNGSEAPGNPQTFDGRRKKTNLAQEFTNSSPWPGHFYVSAWAQFVTGGANILPFRQHYSSAMSVYEAHGLSSALKYEARTRGRNNAECHRNPNMNVNKMLSEYSRELVHKIQQDGQRAKQ